MTVPDVGAFWGHCSRSAFQMQSGSVMAWGQRVERHHQSGQERRTHPSASSQCQICIMAWARSLPSSLRHRPTTTTDACAPAAPGTGHRKSACWSKWADSSPPPTTSRPNAIAADSANSSPRSSTQSTLSSAPPCPSPPGPSAIAKSASMATPKASSPSPGASPTPGTSSACPPSPCLRR